MKLLKLLAALCLCATAWGQGSRFDSGVVTSAANVPPGAQAPLYTVPFASVKVCAYPAVGSPCSNVVNVYSDPALTQLISQPIAADVHGRFGFWAAPGMYAYSVSSMGKVLGTYTIALSGVGGGSATFPSTAGLVYGLNSSTARNANYADIFALFSGSCTGKAVPQADGTCGTAGTGTLTDFIASSGSWPAWLVPSVANHNTAPSLSVTASPIPNSALANSTITVNTIPCALGGTCSVPLTGVSSINGTPGPFTFTGSGVSCTGTTCTFSGGGGSMVYPGAGIANSTGTAWGTSYSATNLIPANFLPVATTGAFGTVKPDGTTITISGGVISSVGGGSGITGLTTGYIPQATSSTAIGNSFIDYGVTNAGAYTSTKDIYAPAFHSTDTGGAGFGFVGAEGTAPAGVAGSDGLWADSTAHALMMNNNNTGAQYVVGSTAFQTLTDGSPITWATGGVRLPNATVTLSSATGTRALNMTGLVSGASGVLIIKQDATGGAAMTGGTGCTWVQAGGGGATFGLTTAANAIDLLAFSYDGTNCYVSMQKNFN